MNLAEFAIKNTVISVIVILLAVIGGWTAYQDMPRFEDPEFTIRTAQVIAPYPGASPTEVAEEVTEALERAIQQMQEVDSIESMSSAGMAEIRVNIKYEFSPQKLICSLYGPNYATRLTTRSALCRRVREQRWYTMISAMFSVFTISSRLTATLRPNCVATRSHCKVRFCRLRASQRLQSRVPSRRRFS